MKNEITLSLFDGTKYAPQSDSPQEIVEKFINYSYVHLRERGFSEEEIITFITSVFPDNNSLIEFTTDGKLIEGIALARATVEVDTHLFSEWTPEEKSQVLDIIDSVIKIANESKEFLELTRNVIAEGIERIKNGEFYPKDSFSLPSHAGMFPILDLFSGRPQYIPRNALLKPSEDRTPEEEDVANDFINSVAKTKSIGYDHQGNEVFSNYVVICDTPKNYATADITDLIQPDTSELGLINNAIYILKAFGPEGLRHFLTILSKFGEQGEHRDVIKWNLNDHLERMGYHRKSHGSYDKRDKEVAIEILRIFTSLNICIYRKKRNVEELNVRQLFSIVGFDVTKDLSSQASKGELIIRADESWYSKPSEINGEMPQFTNILKKILHVNHHHFPHVHFLCIICSLFWRIDLTGRKLKVSTLLNSCGIVTKGKNVKLLMRNFEKELDYMKKEGYLGDWFNLTTEGEVPSKVKFPLKQVLYLEPPMWFKKSIEKILENRAKHVLVELPNEFKILTDKEFTEVIKRSKLSISDFAEKIGVSRQTVSYLKSGSKPISKDVSTKIWNLFPELFTKNVNLI